ncbi:MAG: hypothetical protein U0556_10070 [Dehalococcoidia bacterium]
MTRRRVGAKSTHASQVGRPGASGGYIWEMSERALSEHVRRTFASLPGVLAYHTHDSRRSASGFPDWIVLVGDRAWALELKSAIGRTTPDQGRWLAALGRLPRWTARVVRPEDWPAVRDEIVTAALRGMDPNFTGGLSSEAYVRTLRDE